MIRKIFDIIFISTVIIAVCLFVKPIYALENFNFKAESTVPDVSQGTNNNYMTSLFLDTEPGVEGELELIAMLESGVEEDSIYAARELARIGTDLSILPLLEVLENNLKIEEVLIDDKKKVVIEESELGTTCKNAIITIGRAMGKKVLDLLVDTVLSGNIQNKAVYIPMISIFRKIGTDEVFSALKKIENEAELIYPGISSGIARACMSTELYIDRRLEVEDAYDEFISMGHNIDTVGDIKILEDALLSIYFELIDTYALNDSGDLEEKLSNTPLFWIPEYISVEDLNYFSDNSSEIFQFIGEGYLEIVRNSNDAIIAVQRLIIDLDAGIYINIKVGPVELEDSSLLVRRVGERVDFGVTYISGFFTDSKELMPISIDRYIYYPGSTMPDEEMSERK